MIPQYLQPLAAATYEALGRALANQPIGEADLRNALLFAHQLIAEFAKYGPMMQIKPADIAREGYTVQYSMLAKSGPAFRPATQPVAPWKWDPTAPGNRR